jgi:hypothetical protein
MADFLLLTHGGSMPESPEEGAKVMQAWNDWFAKIAPSIVYSGNPISQARTVSADGSVDSGAGHTITGYTVIKAADLDAAVAIAKGCPLTAGMSAEVLETVKM